MRARYVNIISLADFLAGTAYWAKQGVDLKWESIGPEVDSKEKVDSDAVVLARDYTDKWNSFAFKLNVRKRGSSDSHPLLILAECKDDNGTRTGGLILCSLI